MIYALLLLIELRPLDTDGGKNLFSLNWQDGDVYCPQCKETLTERSKVYFLILACGFLL